MSHPIEVSVTIDVENPQTPLFEKRFSDNRIWSDGHGIETIVGLLNDHGVVGTFFTNVYEYVLWGRNEMERIVKFIHGSGHPVELHTHPIWIDEKRREHMFQFPLKEQEAIIDFGCRFIERGTGRRPLCHRAGAYGFDRNTLLACRRSGIRIDSSNFFGHPNCRHILTVNRIVEDVVVEAPVTIVNKNGQIVKTDIDWLTAEDFEEILEKNRKDSNLRFINLFMHSYSLTTTDDHFTTFRPDPEKIEKFSRILSMLDNTEGYRVIPLSDCRAEEKKESADKVDEPPVASAAPPSDQVVLIWPSEAVQPPMNLLSIGTEIRKAGFTVRIVDPDKEEREDPVALERFVRRHVSPETIWVGLSVMTPMIELALKISRIIRQINPKIRIVWGGAHPTLFPEQTVENPLVDIVAIKDGEQTAVELTRQLQAGGSIEGISGIAFKSGETIRVTAQRDYTDIARLHQPDYSLIDNFRRFSEQKIERHQVRATTLPVHSGSGCPYRCAFCINTALKKPWRCKSADMLADIVEELTTSYGLERVVFVDELFFADKKRVFAFLEQTERRGLKFLWEASMSIHTIKKYTDEELRFLKARGLSKTGFGVESGALSQLKRLNKKITPEEVLTAARRMESVGLLCSYSFLIGTPRETREEMAATFRLMHEIKRTSPRYSLIYWAQIYRPYPGSPIYDEAVEAGFQAPEALEGWSEMSVDPNNAFTRCEDLPWLNYGKTNLIEDLNRCVSVYLKRDHYLAPEAGHTVNLPDRPGYPIGEICKSLLDGSWRDRARYSEHASGGRRAAVRDREIVFVKANPQLRIYKEAFGLKKSGNYRLTLLANRYDEDLFKDVFDEVIPFQSASELQGLVKSRQPLLFHAHAEPNVIPAIVMESASVPVVYDTYDFAGIRAGIEQLSQEEKFAEKYCLENAAGIVNKFTDELLQYYRDSGYRISENILPYQDYCLRELMQPLPSNGHRPEAWHLVYAGAIAPAHFDPDRYRYIQFHELGEALARQGVHFHLYPNGFQYDPSVFECYAQMDRNLPHVHFHAPVPYRELARELSRYHWGCNLHFRDPHPVFGDKRPGIGNKYPAYMEAGLPIIVNDQLDLLSRFVSRFQTGIVIGPEDVERIGTLFDEVDYSALRRRIEERRMAFSVEAHAPRLVEFYENLS